MPVQIRDMNIPSCSLQRFGSAASLSQDILARLRRRRKASSTYRYSVAERAEAEMSTHFAELLRRSLKVASHIDVFMQQNIQEKNFNFQCFGAFVLVSESVLGFHIISIIYELLRHICEAHTLKAERNKPMTEMIGMTK